MKKFILITLGLLLSIPCMAELDKIHIEQTDLIVGGNSNDYSRASEGTVRTVLINTSGTTNLITVTISTVADRGRVVSETIAVISATNLVGGAVGGVLTNLTQPSFLVGDVIRAASVVNKLDGTNTYGTADVSVIIVLDDD